MRFDELILQVPDDEVHVRFHPRLTVLSGLGAADRQELAGSLLGALAGTSQDSALRYVDGTGRAVARYSGEGRHEDDGTPAEPPLGALTASLPAVRELVLAEPVDIFVRDDGPDPDEPPDLAEARATLAELTAALDAAEGHERRMAEVRAEVEALDAQLEEARESRDRREYAQVLADLERRKTEAGVLRSGTESVDADQRLVRAARGVDELAERWAAAADHRRDAEVRLGVGDRLSDDERAEAARIPDEAPAELASLIVAAVDAAARRDTVSRRLQALAVAKLPAPSDLLVGELGLLEQASLWRAADRLLAALAEVQRVQLSIGGLGGDDVTEGAGVIGQMEAAHRVVEEAEAAAESVRITGVAGTGLGLALTTAGLIGEPLFIPVGLLIAGVVATFTLILPRRRIAEAEALERTALDEAGAGSYLGFHLRRVDAAVDPDARAMSDLATARHRSALEAWTELVGPDVDVHRARELAAEVQEYHEALQRLGGAADEIEQLRRELAEEAEPALAAALAELAAASVPFGLTADDLHDASTAAQVIQARIDLGHAARRQAELEDLEAAEHDVASTLDQQLASLGFTAGDRAARVSAFEWAVARAAEREQMRSRGRDPEDVEAELQELEAAARRLHRPEWSEVTSEEAAAPDIEELEARRATLLARREEDATTGDVTRLRDRHAALERRVSALVARYRVDGAPADPDEVADIQQHLLAHLTKAAQAGPHGDPVPAILDEVLVRVPAERTWDLLDLLYRLSERHQIVYLSDDPFVAAWARQCPVGAVMLLEPEPEVV